MFINQVKMKVSSVYILGMFSLLAGIIGVTYYYDILGGLYWVLVLWTVMAVVGLTVLYKMVDCDKSVRIPLNVLYIDNEIDYWRGKLCTARQQCEVEDEIEAMLHIDIYHELRMQHGLKRLPRVDNVI